MAQIDVTELLHDPDFVDQIELITRTPFINSLGENSIRETCKKSVGSVQPATGKAIQRLPDSLRVANVSSFWFQGEIVASEPGQYTSILVFKRRRYQVQFIFDWANWGSGYTEGTCIAETPAP